MDPGSGSAQDNLSIFTSSKNSRKNDLGGSSRILNTDPDFFPSQIPDPGVKKAKITGSGSSTLVMLFTRNCCSSLLPV